MTEPPEFAAEIDPIAPTVWVGFDLPKAIRDYRLGFYFHRANSWRRVICTQRQHDWRCLAGRAVIIDHSERNLTHDDVRELVRQLLHDGAKEVYFLLNNTEWMATCDDATG